jgi:hypothetical protein
MPLACQDEGRQYVWALLDPEVCIPPADNAVRIESPAAATEVPVTPTPKQGKMSPVSEPATNPNSKAPSNGQANTTGRTGQTTTNGQAKANGQARGTGKSGRHEIDALIQQAETLRTSLRETLLKNNELLKGLKRHRRQSRALQTTLASLRQLKTLGV